MLPTTRSILFLISICAGLLFTIIVITSCKKQSEAPPAWFSTYKAFHYDYSNDNVNIPDYRLLSISDGFSADELFFYETPVDTPITSWTDVMEVFGNGLFKPKDDGLYSTSSSTCGGFSLSSFDYLFVPADAVQGASMPQYGCNHTDEGNNEILNADTLITVPAGAYHVFCMRHPNGDRSYWNREVGIVMYEQYEHDPSRPFRRLAALKLRSMQ